MDMGLYPYLVNSRALHSVVDALLGSDVRPGTLLRRLQIPASAVLIPETWISNRIVLEIAAEAGRTTGDQFFGLHVGELIRFERNGVWGESIVRAPTLRAAFDACIKNLRYCHSDIALHFHEEGRRASVTLNILGNGPSSARPYHECAVTFLRRIMALTGEQLPATISLPHSRPRNTSELERVLGLNLDFRAACSGLTFDRELLDLPLTKASTESPSSRVSKWPGADPVARAAIKVIAETIQYEPATIRGTAAALGLHIRTFQRHLDRWGTTFEALLDDFRRERACTLLRSGTCTVTDIAFRLGYSDAAHFTRAFHRWKGMAPRHFAAQIIEDA
jgi:AraC-like DNA-binding protein